MIFNFLSPPNVGGDYRGGFLALIWTKAAMTSNIGALLSTLPTYPRPDPSEEGKKLRRSGIFVDNIGITNIQSSVGATSDI